AAQLPQIVKESDLKYFFTQKLSWNNINKFPHTTFWWKGLDGTSVLTHFSPADTYVAQNSVRDVVFSVKNNKDKEYSNKSLILYGNGDGGGGPLRPMIERLERLKAVEGLPATVKFGHPNDFFEELEKTSRDLNTWKGELYFELHRGTYTSQAATKKSNRKSEYLLREIEFLSVLALVSPKCDPSYVNPKQELDRLWKLVLLNQFHDVLPGSSIEMVYDDAKAFYEDVRVSGGKLRKAAVDAVLKGLGGGGETSQAVSVINTTSWNLSSALVEVDISALKTGAPLFMGSTWQQLSSNGKALVLVDDVPSMAIKTFGLGNKPSPFSPVSVKQVDKSFHVENNLITVNVNSVGEVVSIFDKINKREVIAPGHTGNVFRMFEDIPLYWDAWDVEVYHLEKGWKVESGSVEISEMGPLRVVLSVKKKISATSSLEQKIIVQAMSSLVEFDTVVHWNENRVIMKVEFPFNINCDYATYETQFGYIQRPTHYNNSWDLARFEVCGHKYADLSEYEYGVALLNDCKYGYSCKDNIMRLSLLRSPKAPDAHCDIGTHQFSYAIYPHKGAFLESDVVKVAYQYNVPPVVQPVLVNPTAATQVSGKGNSYFSVDKENLVLDTVKIAEEPRVGKFVDVVVRFYEANGGRGVARIQSGLKIVEAKFCNVMEDLAGNVEVDGDGALVVAFTPFKIITLRLLVSKE
ncbi:Alpha-mannosidase 2C1, partial [Blyttiomyces sp. JEL0837]